MKHLSAVILAGALGALSVLPSFIQGQDYTNFIRQIHVTTGLQWDIPVEAEGSQLAPFPIVLGGSQFELYTVKNSPLTSYLLDTRYVNSYVPVGEIEIISEDPYDVIPRTRADRPFQVKVTVNGLLSGSSDPLPSKQVTLLHHAQSYNGGNGQDVDRNQATLQASSSITSNGTTTLEFAITQVPGNPRNRVRGEERISIFSLADYQADASQIASDFIQIWPVASGEISGLNDNDVYKGRMPELEIELSDLYPNSQTYAQVYKGALDDGVEGIIVPGSALVLNSTVPEDHTLEISGWDEVFEEDGNYTLEVLTITPFGVDRLGSKTFEVDRIMEVNGAVTSVE
ncbi:MAG: hypothetical protein P1U68_04760 [Verrucomicrobiales bacterium]|nr:hypothetical protein [Verrucomicrobiales bacterium]